MNKILLFLILFFAAQIHARRFVNSAFLRPLDVAGSQPVTQPPVPQGPAGPFQVQFVQLPQKTAVEFKAVEGSNDGGTTTTPDKNLAAWYSEALYDIPKEVSWADDDAPDVDDAQDAEKKAEEKGKKDPKASLAPQKAASSGTAGIASMGMGAVGNAKNQNALNEVRSLKQARAQQGASAIKSAETSRKEKIKKFNLALKKRKRTVATQT